MPPCSATVMPELRREDLDQLTRRELSGLFLAMLRIRWGGAGLLTVLAMLLAVYDPEPWTIALPLAGVTVLVLASIRDRPLLRATTLQPQQIAMLMASILVAQAILITITGGIHSPFLVVLPAMSLLTSVGAGRLGPAIGVGLALVLFAWGLAAVDLAGLSGHVVPAVLSRHITAGGGPGFALTIATVLTVVTTATLVFGLLIRRAVERAVRSAHEARAETLATMRERNAELWALAGTIAHELKNPLASVKGLGSLLARRVEPGTPQAERMGVMLDEVERMGAIIDEFLNFSRPLTAMTRRPTEPAALVDTVLALCGPLAAARGVTLERRVEASRALSCDPRKVVQVLVNLLNNAVDASDPHGTVVVVARSLDEHVSFAVLDDGPGLAPEVRARLFRPGTTTKAGGSGIGLTVARAIAEQHGGALTLHDRAEGGCLAELRLPLAAPEPAPPEPAPSVFVPPQEQEPPP